MTSRTRCFASDNNAGACPEVLAAVAAANPGHVPAYGSDDVTDLLQALIRAEWGGRRRKPFRSSTALVAMWWRLGPPAGRGRP